MNDLIIYLGAMVLVVPVVKLLGLGSVIGYLIAGVLIGPSVFHLLSTHAEGASEVAEFGVIMMLLLIGLELNPRILWKMRGPIFGMGTVQVVASALAVWVGLVLYGYSYPSALALGLILSLSSTAIALQTLKEQGYAKTLGGERAFQVLLFQDMAVIPILAIFAWLGMGQATSGGAHQSGAIPVLLAVGAVIVGGRFLLKPIFRLIAKIKLRETFTAVALLIVVGSAALMHQVGVSPALGAFLAGVVLAESEFRHQIETDIEPFKGLLLGLFFMTIGSQIQFQVLQEFPIQVLAFVLVIFIGKGVILYSIGRAFKIPRPESMLFSVALAQGGEFAFVLLAGAHSVIDLKTVQVVTLAIALSMALAPVLIKLTIRFIMMREECLTNDSEKKSAPDSVSDQDKENPLLVIGIGRFGQTLTRLLRASGFKSTVLDIDSEQIEVMARFGIRSYFGDGTNLDLLKSAGLASARGLIIAIDDPEATLKIVEQVRHEFPGMPIFCRAFDRVHVYKLLSLGVKAFAIETSGSAIQLGTDVMVELGVDPERARHKAKQFQIGNDLSIRELSKQFNLVDRDTFIQASKTATEQMEAMLRADEPAAPL